MHQLHRKWQRAYGRKRKKKFQAAQTMRHKFSADRYVCQYFVFYADTGGISRAPSSAAPCFDSFDCGRFL